MSTIKHRLAETAARDEAAYHARFVRRAKLLLALELALLGLALLLTG